LRELPLDRPGLERIRDWNEFHLHLDEKKLREQGARCMDCGVPFCHTGKLLSGMASGCPINNLIPEWNDLVYRGLWREALERLHKTNNFPDFTGRVCPAPCEGSCVLGIIAPPVTIKNIECAIVDRGWEEGWIKPEPPPAAPARKVAVIGSGPAGLCAAAQLNRAGHLVTVFERADRIGGLLMYGIPNMKLDKGTGATPRRSNGRRRRHLHLPTPKSARIIPPKTFLREFDAVVLCTGATKPRDLPVEGPATSKAFISPWNFSTPTPRACWTAQKRRAFHLRRRQGRRRHRRRRHRHRLRRHRHAARLQEPGAIGNPAAAAPGARQGQSVARMAEGLQAGLRPGGSRRQIRRRPARLFDHRQEIHGDESAGHVKEVHTVQIEWKRNEKGQFTAVEVPGTEQVRPAQLVLLAMGFLGPEQPLLEQLGVERDARTNVKAEHEKYATNIRAFSPPATPPRPEPGRLGLQRRPRRRPRVRPLPDGPSVGS
jgi:glutamate synthase (NADPH/NADH) small chain